MRAGSSDVALDEKEAMTRPTLVSSSENFSEDAGFAFLLLNEPFFVNVIYRQLFSILDTIFKIDTNLKRKQVTYTYPRNDKLIHSLLQILHIGDELKVMIKNDNYYIPPCTKTRKMVEEQMPRLLEVWCTILSKVFHNLEDHPQLESRLNIIPKSTHTLRLSTHTLRPQKHVPPTHLDTTTLVSTYI